MEETNCEQAEAELALQLANYDFEKAIRTIKTALRNIAILKGKFFNSEQNIYGIFISILDKHTENIIRIRSVVSYNPAVYEIDLNTEWHIIEKTIYSYKLLEGSIPSLTRTIELYLSKVLALKKDIIYKALSNNSEQEISELITSDFPIPLSKFQLLTEEINLVEYQQEKKIEEKEKKQIILDIEPKQLYLEAKLLEDKTGKTANALSEKDIVLARISDDREIGKYLSKLFCSKENEYLPVEIEKIEKTNTEILIKLSFAPRIIGVTKLSPKTRIKVIKKTPKPFWKKLLGIK